MLPASLPPLAVVRPRDTLSPNHQTSKSTTRPRSPAIVAPHPRNDHGRERANSAHADTRRTSDAGESGAAATAAAAEKKARKPKKRGWKGYAMQYFDDDGNLVEERVRDETPEEERAEARALAAAAAAAADPVHGTAEATASTNGAIAMEGQEAPSSTRGPSLEASASRAIHSDPVTSKRVHSPSPDSAQPDALLAGLGGINPVVKDGPPDAQTPKGVVAAAYSPAPEPARPASKAESSRLANSTSAREKDKDRLPPKKRRKTSLSATPQPAGESRATSSVPRPALPTHKGKARSSLPAPPTHAQPPPLTARQIGIAANNAAVIAAKEAREAREAASARATPYVVEDDTPLPKLPRKGMGDDQPVPPDSDLRAEALFILEAADKHRQALAASNMADTERIEGQPNSPPLTADDTALPGPLRISLANGNGHGDHATSYRTPAPTANGLYHPPPPMDQPVSYRYRQSEVTTDEEFELQFAALQDFYSDQQRHAMPMFVDEPRPPKFHPGQRPTIILAPTYGKAVGRLRDKHERAYMEGFDGLPEDYEREIVGFIDNVRSNMKTVVQFYFENSTLRRDAFIERLGRELTKLGSQLTDDGEAAILRRRPEPVEYVD